MLSIIGGGIALIGLFVMLIGSVWFLIEAFREGILWGLATLFIPPCQLLFLVLHWSRAKKPFILQLEGFAAVFIGALITDARLPFIGWL